MYIYMGTKSITITDEAYQRLSVFKESKESFSDVINKITRKYSLLDLVGVLTDEGADEMRDYLKDMQKRMRRGMERTLSEIQ